MRTCCATRKDVPADAKKHSDGMAVEYAPQYALNLVTKESERLPSGRGYFKNRERDLNTLSVGSWGSSSAGLESLKARKRLLPLLGIRQGFFSQTTRILVTILTEPFLLNMSMFHH